MTPLCCESLAHGTSSKGTYTSPELLYHSVLLNCIECLLINQPLLGSTKAELHGCCSAWTADFSPVDAVQAEGLGPSSWISPVGSMSPAVSSQGFP